MLMMLAFVAGPKQLMLMMLALAVLRHVHARAADAHDAGFRGGAQGS